MPIGYFPEDPPTISGDNVTKDVNAKKPFGGKKAAPFKPGGGRKQSSPRTHKGTPRKKSSGK